MNESVKTLSFVGVAVLVAVAAWSTGPRSETETQASLVNKDLVDAINLLDVANLEIVEFNEAKAALLPFVVERKKVKGEQDTWVIPSHEDYPADAENQLGEAVAALNGLRVLEVATDNAGEHTEFGVLDPDMQQRKAGDRGVGKRATVRDAAGKPLISLIVGKEAPGGSGLRYVRLAGNDHVVVVKLAADKFTTDFNKWIEKDLLKLSPWDIKEVKINDYALDMSGGLDPGNRLALSYNDMGDPRWKLAADKVYNARAREWKDLTMAPNEELDTAKLDAMKTALDDLKIVNVNRKPAGLSADLKVNGDAIKRDRAAFASLVPRGFVVADAGMGDGPQFYSTHGEVFIAMKDGVEYVLRFGDDTGEQSKESDEAKDGAKDEAKDKPAGMNRYLLVAARFNPDAVAKPELEKEPAVDEAKPEEKKADEAKAEEKTEEKKPDAAAELNRVRQENKRLMDAYEEQLEKGRQHAKELNDRFADWYYVIPNGEFDKIHLSREQLVKPKEAKDAAAGDDHGHDHKHNDVDKFDHLKSGGLEGK